MGPDGQLIDAKQARDRDRERDRDKEKDRKHRRSKHTSRHHHSHSNPTEADPPPLEREPRGYPLAEHLCNVELLAPLVIYLTFPEFYALWTSTKLVKGIVEDTDELREVVLERFLGPVGYKKWMFKERREPVTLTLMVSAHRRA